MASQYFVCDEHTLCYQIEGDPMMGVLAGSVIRGGRNPLDGVTHASTFRKIRPATVEDFAAYRVMPPRHFSQPTTGARETAALAFSCSACDITAQ